MGVKSARNAGMQIIWVLDTFTKGVFEGIEEKILGPWGREVESLAHVNLEDYGIGV